MWSERFNLTDIRELDKIVREVMNQVHAKYSLQMNASLYLPRRKGGRGLKNLEMIYKKTKIKAAMNLLTTSDPRITCVKDFDMDRMNKGKSSTIKDAIKYAKEDFALTFLTVPGNFEVKYTKSGEDMTTSDVKVVKELLNERESTNVINEIQKSTWQGLLLKSRYNDADLIEGSFGWLTNWKDCPVQVVNDALSVYLQIVPTLTFVNYRSGNANGSTKCRLCNADSESVRHLLSQCTKFLNTAYKRRHDRVLQYIIFRFLKRYSLVESTPPWYSKIVIKPQYENDDVLVLWDIPEYSGYDDEEEDKVLRPDGKIILKKDKKIYVLEMSVPWITNRDSKIDEKMEKYASIVQTLKVDNPLFKVQQLTFIADCLGGYSKSFTEALRTLGFDKHEIKRMCLDIQKIIVTEATSTINRFKILTMK